ncbi:MAG: electron transfer flavoprotein subunit beta/FixA family protein, partial [Vicinamibacteria bacterium]|nr:electron transfer flavoprotein subunit beta/FixA family protein [Vicinamibacteria bacterium]
MKIVVCLKVVPDTASRLKVAEDGKHIVQNDLTWIISPYDEIAIEEGLRLREKLTGEVVLISIGPERVVAGLRTGLAMGADSAHQIWDPAFEGLDAAGRATVLAAAIKHLGGADLILCGHQGVGEDDSQTPGLLAGALDLPTVSMAIKLDIEGTAAVVEREVEGGIEVWDATLPAVISTQKGLNTPRYAGLKGIMAAKKKTMGMIDAAALGLGAEALAAKTERRTLALPAERPPVKLIAGDPAVQAKELIRLLH